jgi:hypothetical protein
MHPMPPAEHFQPLIGDEIAQVCLDPYQVQFAFSSGRLLVAEHVIEHIEPDGTTHGYDCQSSDKPPVLLHRLLSGPIVAVEREELALTLRFEDGSALRIYSMLGPYESGHSYMTPNDMTHRTVF